MPGTSPLRAARHAAGIRLEQAAVAVDVSTSTVHRWETGVAIPRLDQATKLAALLGAPLDVFETT